MAAESVQIEGYLYGLFTGDSTLQPLVGSHVFAYLGGIGDSLPAILMESQGGVHDTSALDGTRVWTPYLYSIKAVGRGGDMTGLQPIADRIDALLNGQIHALSGVQLRFRREQPLSLLGVPFGAVYYSYLGGVYRVACSPIT